jgi:arylformamidase
MQQNSTTSGPLVWRDLDQQALDDAYDQDVYAPNRPLIVTRRIAASERARAILSAPQRVAYGPSEYEQLDIFRAPSPASGGGKQKGAPINIFIHGGAWRRNKGPDYHLQAEPLVRAGAHCLIADFINVEQAGGDLFPMYEQVRRAIAWAWRNAETYGGDRERFYISAHSSGSHLTACVLTRGWQEEGLPEDFCKGALLLSGMYDLEAVRLSKRSAYVKFTDAMVEQLSSQRHLDGLRTPLVLAYGTQETPEFQRQTREFLAAGAGDRRSGRADRGRGLQSFRAAGDARQSVRPDRARAAAADETGVTVIARSPNGATKQSSAGA